MLIDLIFDDGNTGAQGIGGALSTTSTVTVNITSYNFPPQLVNSPPSQTAVVRVALSYTLPADTFSDPDGDPLELEPVYGGWYWRATVAELQPGHAGTQRHAD